MNESYNDIFNTNPKLVTILGTLIGLIIIDDLSTLQQNVIGNFLISIGQTILTNASSQGLIESRIKGGIININSKETKSIYNPPIYNIDKIKKIINELYPSTNINTSEIEKTLNKITETLNELKK